MRTVQLVNPNTSTSTTAMMLDTARAVAPPDMRITGLTARSGSKLIVDAEMLAAAGDAVTDLWPDLNGDGVIVAAFGDPGVAHLRRLLDVPVIGIGEAAIRAAVAGTAPGAHRRFSIVTTTPRLEQSIRNSVAALGLSAQLASVHITTADPVILTADAGRLEAELLALVEHSIHDDGAEAIIIGGGPLARAAKSIARRTGSVIIEPVPAAVAWMAQRLQPA